MAATVNWNRDLSPVKVRVFDVTADAATATVTLPDAPDGMAFYWNKSTNAVGVATSYVKSTGVITVPAANTNNVQIYFFPFA